MTYPLTDFCTALPQLRTPAAIEENKPPPPPPDVAAVSWSLDPIAGDLRGQTKGELECGGGVGVTLGFGGAAGRQAGGYLPRVDVEESRGR